jgi:hypothetical protein
VRRQNFEDWEHIIQCDSDKPFWKGRPFPYEAVYVAGCGIHHNNFGNTCRNIAWKSAIGRYVIYLDDDNYLADGRVLESIWDLITRNGYPDVCVFPILRYGTPFYAYPVGKGRTDTANLVVKREYAQWPDVGDYEADGMYAEMLAWEHPVTGFPEMRPIVVMEGSGHGQ